MKIKVAIIRQEFFSKAFGELLQEPGVPGESRWPLAEVQLELDKAAKLIESTMKGLIKKYDEYSKNGGVMAEDVPEDKRPEFLADLTAIQDKDIELTLDKPIPLKQVKTMSALSLINLRDCGIICDANVKPEAKAEEKKA